MNDSYRAYIETSDLWREKREARLDIDKHKCVVCGRPFDLQVHHLTYERIYNECPLDDLVTLCRSCHQRAEAAKETDFAEEMEFSLKKIQCRNNQAYIYSMVDRFIEENKHNDLSNVGVGQRDYCKIKDVQEDLFRFFYEHNLYYHNERKMPGTMYVQGYFRNRRYEIILNYMDRHFPAYEVRKRTMFSMNMIKKVYENPEQARQIIIAEEERRNAET